MECKWCKFETKEETRICPDCREWLESAEAQDECELSADEMISVIASIRGHMEGCHHNYTKCFGDDPESREYYRKSYVKYRDLYRKLKNSNAIILR